MKSIFYSFLLLGLFFSCEKSESVDRVEGNTNEVRQEAVAGFDYMKVFGTFKGKFKYNEAVLQLESNGEYKLSYQGDNFEGKYFHRNGGSLIELEFMEYQSSLPFSLLRIEDPSYLVILENEQDTDFYLELVEE